MAKLRPGPTELHEDASVARPGSDEEGPEATEAKPRKKGRAASADPWEIPLENLWKISR